MDLEREKEIRKRMERRYAMRAEFFSHFIAYLVFNAGVWFFFLDPFNPMQDGWHILGLIISGGWSIGIAIHFVQYYFAEMREKAIQREIDRERELDYGKAKRGERLVKISDDGELFDTEEEEPRKRYR